MPEFALIVVLFAVAAFFAYRQFVRRGKEMSMLVSRGTEVTGKVIGVRRIRRSRTHTAFRVRYAFVTSGGIEYEREIEVLPKEFEQFSEGQPIEIVYDPVNPEVNMLKKAVSAARKAMRDRQMS